MASRPPTQQQRVEQSRSRLIVAAAELITEAGYEAASAAEISRRAGYSRSMVHARFGSKERLVDAVIASAYEGPLSTDVSESATGRERVLARLDAMATLVAAKPGLLRTIFAIEFQATGNSTSMAIRVAHWVAHLRTDTLDAIVAGQADGSVRADLDPESTAHAIVAEGIGSAFVWTVTPSEDFPARIAQWHSRTVELLEPR